MDRNLEADAFFDRVERFLTEIAVELGLGTAKGSFTSGVTGTTRSFTVFGTYGKLWIACIFEASESWLALEQARLRWYVTDSLSPMDLGRIHGKPLILRIVRGFDELERDVRIMLGFLRDQTVEQVVEQLCAPTFAAIAEMGGASGDPDNDLPS